MECCSNPKLKLVEELGHAESVDFDLVQCISCGGYRMRSWSEYRPDTLFYEAMTPDEAAEFRASQGISRKQLLKDWFNSH
jgi:hypothetical protein